jgi:hypothetical protein
MLDTRDERVPQSSNHNRSKTKSEEREHLTQVPENETAPDAAAKGASGDEQNATPTEEISYHAVEKDGQVTAIWEMRGRKHLRTIDPRSRQGQEILRLYTADQQDEAAAQESGDAASV